ncbi:MAG: tRNA 2-thiouridine(34) synthase MnmA [Ruminococcus sp.]|nr:tRNA 2-thiouridine(34) synthase MnmA [Ruminococcus sp.]
MEKKAIIAMSGGVDSSVAAFIMKEKGFHIIGVTMKLYDNEDIGIDTEKTCCSLSDIEDARSVCYKLGSLYYVFNFKAEFKYKIIDDFINTYENGGTPNPCIRCNRYLKFEKLMHRMFELQYDYVVTGHYARVEKRGDRYILKKAVDLTKDQSYVLYNLTQEQLKHIRFPLGEMNKTEVRKIAEENGFINANKRDSQDICFVPNGKYAEFIEEFTGKTYPEGDFVDTNGNVLGRHKGIIRYTIGQRKGLGLALPCPMYVKEKDLNSNRVVLCVNDELFSTTLYADDFNWLSIEQPKNPIHCKARIRYNQKEQPATAEVMPDGSVKVVFEQPQRAICKGQAVVLYDEDVVLGGGTIL